MRRIRLPGAAQHRAKIADQRRTPVQPANLIHQERTPGLGASRNSRRVLRRLRVLHLSFGQPVQGCTIQLGDGARLEPPIRL